MPALHRDVLTPNAIRAHAHGLADLAATNPAATPVPTCGDWTLADLTWHLAEVHDFWTWIIEHRPDGPDAYAEPTRPPDGELPSLLRGGADRFAALLGPLPDDEPAWSWSDDHTVGFTIRRQTHEALIHHVDALLACDAPIPPIDPRLGADGVDELVRRFLGGVPEWASFTPDGRTIALATTDTGDRWPLRRGRMTGTSPASGTTYDLTAYDIDPDLDATATTVRGPAAALDLWIWGRAGTDELEIEGDSAGAVGLRAEVVESTQ